MKDMRFEGIGGAVKVILCGPQVEMMASHRQVWPWSVERGGLLFAASVGATDGVVPISMASPPDAADRAGRTWLKLNHDRCLKKIKEQFGSGRHFVGYWHTHPERDPRLSAQDRSALQPLLDDPGIDLDRLVLAVIGGSRRQLAVHVAILDRRSGNVHELTEVEDLHDSTAGINAP